MRGFVPPRPTGFDPEALFDQSTHDKTHGLESKIISSSTVRVNRTSRGISFRAAGMGGSSGVTVGLYRMQVALSGNPAIYYGYPADHNLGQGYIICRTWDGVTEGDKEIAIALPPKLRRIDHDTENGVTIVNYLGYQDYVQERRAYSADGLIGEQQAITPPYFVGDLIYAVRARTLVHEERSAGGDPTKKVRLLDLNIDGRAWASYSALVV